MELREREEGNHSNGRRAGSQTTEVGVVRSVKYTGCMGSISETDPAPEMLERWELLAMPSLSILHPRKNNWAEIL